jgi:hypothetical protein
MFVYSLLEHLGGKSENGTASSNSRSMMDDAETMTGRIHEGYKLRFISSPMKIRRIFIISALGTLKKALTMLPTRDASVPTKSTFENLCNSMIKPAMKVTFS